MVDTTTTDENGDYCFEDVVEGTYSVRFQAPSDSFETGKTFVAPDAGDDDGVDSDVIDPATGETAQFTIEAGDVKKDVDAGIEKPLGEIGGRYFCDENRDDVDTNEAGVSGATVELLDANGEVVDTTTTDDNGDYCFEDVVEGTYSVRFQAPSDSFETGKTFVAPDAGDDDGVAPASGATKVLPVSKLSDGAWKRTE